MSTAATLEIEASEIKSRDLPETSKSSYQPLKQVPGDWHFALWPKAGLSNHWLLIESGQGPIIKPISPLISSNRLPLDILCSIRQAEQTRLFDILLLAASTKALLEPMGRLDGQLLVIGFTRTEENQPVQLGQRSYPALSDILPRLVVNSGYGSVISPVHIPNLRIVG